MVEPDRAPRTNLGLQEKPLFDLHRPGQFPFDRRTNRLQWQVVVIGAKRVLDLHADLNVPDSEPEGALDWMGMAHLLGEQRAVPELSRRGPRFPLLEAADVCIFGHGLTRATPWEREVIARRGIRTVPVEDVAANPEGAAARALAALDGYDALLIHFDVDVIDFTDAPLSENTGRNEGLTLDQAFRALRILTTSPIFRALTITELNPLHGEEDGTTVERFVGELVETLAGVPALGGRR